MNAHPAADLFPMMGDAELAELAADIRANGQIEAIIALDGLILDGRNRWLACQQAEVEPRVVEYDGPLSPVAYVLSANLHRRHLTTSQRAMVAAAAVPLFEAEAKERMLAGKRPDPSTDLHQGSQGKAAEQVARVVGVSSTSVYHARRLAKEAPDLAEQVKAGTTSVDRATKVLRQRAAKGGDTTPPTSKRKPTTLRHVTSEQRIAQEAAALERATRASVAIDTLERLGTCRYTPAEVAAAVRPEQRFRVDAYLKQARDWLDEFCALWTNDNDPA